MRPYLLLTPGPLTTSESVKQAMMSDWCTWDNFYQKLKEKEFVIYPGKISQADTFRIGNIGDVFPDDFRRLVDAIRNL